MTRPPTPPDGFLEVDGGRASYDFYLCPLLAPGTAAVLCDDRGALFIVAAALEDVRGLARRFADCSGVIVEVRTASREVPHGPPAPQPSPSVAPPALAGFYETSLPAVWQFLVGAPVLLRPTSRPSLGAPERGTR